MPQTQTPTRYGKPGRVRDYSPAADVYCGDIVVIANRCFLAATDIAASATAGLGLHGTPTRGGLHTEGIWFPPKDASTFADGDPVFWLPTGNPNGGTAGTGAATSAPAGATFLGYAVMEDGATSLTGDATLAVEVGDPKGRVTVNADVAAAGSVIGDAAAVYEGFTCVTGADATKGVLLPVGVPGMVVELKNIAAAVLKVWPRTGAQINAVAASTSMSIAASVSVRLVCKTPTQWYTFPLLPS